MYEIERKEDRVIIRSGSKPVYIGVPESFLIYREVTAGTQPVLRISRVKELNDEQLLLALANVAELKELSTA